MPVSELRIVERNAVPVRTDGEYVLYWMTSARRATWNFALDRAREWARELSRPLLVFEGLRADYPWASERITRFIRGGMGENRRRFERAGIRYYAHIEERAGHSKGLLQALSARACVVVGDEFPCFFMPRMTEAASKRVGVRMETVDSNGLLPLRATPKVFPTAHSFRRFLQRELPAHLSQRPRARLVRAEQAARVSDSVLRRWPETKAESDGSARKAMRAFGGTGERPSGLSPYLHFGHISAHQVFAQIARREDWAPVCLGSPTGSRQGWWGMSETAEQFLDQLVTWRELGYHNASVEQGRFDKYEALPEWARETLAIHAGDPRPHLYTRKQFERAETHDELWNAAQRELVYEGRMHGYLRMLWGKKILEWSKSPRAALNTMIELNNRYALDGRDPNSCTGIFWVLGRYDRPWGPERPVFGKVRYMTSRNTLRKLPLADYLRRYGR